MTARTSRQKAHAAAADMLTQVKALIVERGGKTTEDSVPETEWNEIIERTAADHGISVGDLTAALSENGSVINRRKKMN